MQFSFYSGGIRVTKPTQAIGLEELVDLIRNGTYDLVIQALRVQEDKKFQRQLKAQLDYVTPAGVFEPTRADENCAQRSGLIVIDFDDVENLPETAVQLAHDPFTRLLFVSPSGTGLKLFVEIETEREHKDYFNDLSFYFQREYELIPDASGKDVSRACFLSYDPNTYYNPDSTVWKYRGLTPPKKATKTKELVSTVSRRSTDGDTLSHVRLVVDRIEAAGIDITSSYSDEWLLIAFCLSTLGEDGRELFHRVSRFNPKYEEKDVDAKFTNAVRTCRFTNPAKFFSIAKDYGVDIRQRETVSGPAAFSGPQSGATLTPGEKPAKAKSPAAEAKGEGRDEISKRPRLSTALSSVIFDNDDFFTIQVKAGRSWVTCCDGYVFYIRYVTEDEQENVSWILEFQLEDETRNFTLELTNKEFLSPDAFDEAIASRGLALNAAKGELKLIRTYNFQRFGVKKAVKVIRFGYHEPSQTYFFSNKAFDGKILEPDANNIIHT
ncbi:MAG: PriCT-2 domain-containing protein, partial [Siphonobacter aquaeclarae]|nr:PriCT-2 domain-containing protein [Siphonobacter aquaeclarae]